MFGLLKCLLVPAAGPDRNRSAERSELSDIGAYRGRQLREIVEMPEEVRRRMAAMARVFGVAEARLTDNRAEYVEVLTLCAACRALGQCRHERPRARRPTHPLAHSA